MRMMLIAGLLTGCGGAGDDTAEPLETDAPPTATNPTSTQVSHDADIQPIWNNTCGGSSCHTDGGAKGGLALDDGHAATVGVSSQQLPSMALVTAGETDESYLWHKIVDTHEDVGGDGDAMPRGTGTISSGDVDLIEMWILEGANP